VPLPDVPARLIVARLAGQPSWLIVCRRCAWHCETTEGSCWRGCPNCSAELWLVWPDGSSETMMLAASWHAGFRAKRRRNRWRMAPPIAGSTNRS